jgi:uncharacterized protein YbjT (DUF2867 family)
MILIVGATGQLGCAVCRQLAAQGRAVRGLVRPHNVAKAEALRAMGVETVAGDLKDPASLAKACHGIETVISTASATLSRCAGDDIDSVDRQGQLNLVEAARAAGVRHFIFVSFPAFARAFPLQDAKRAVEARIQASGMAYTLLHPMHFREVWLGPSLGFDLAGGTARLFGEGDGPVNWIALDDVRDAVAACVDNPRVANKTLPLAGVEALSQRQVAERFERHTGRPLTLQSMPLPDLEAMYRSDDPLQQSFAALMLACTGPGFPLPTPGSWDLLGLSPRPFDGFIAATLPIPPLG